MMQLMELGYSDYDKNYKVVKKLKKTELNVGAALDKLNKA